MAICSKTIYSGDDRGRYEMHTIYSSGSLERPPNSVFQALIPRPRSGHANYKTARFCDLAHASPPARRYFHLPALFIPHVRRCVQHRHIIFFGIRRARRSQPLPTAARTRWKSSASRQSRTDSVAVVAHVVVFERVILDRLLCVKYVFLGFYFVFALHCSVALSWRRLSPACSCPWRGPGGDAMANPGRSRLRR